MTKSQPLRLARYFGDGMVLQQGRRVPVWGWAPPGETVTVRFGGQTKRARAGAHGRWQARLAPMPTFSRGRELTVQAGDRQIVLHDVLVGQVWLVSGQSNVVFNLKTATGGLEAAADADDMTAVRHLTVDVSFADEPLEDLEFENRWVVCNSQTAPHMSAIAFYFARRLRQAFETPVGLVVSAMGGSRIEAWMPRAALKRVRVAGDVLAAAERGSLTSEERDFFGLHADQHMPCKLFNTMIAPLQPAALGGVLWYQGESNAVRPGMHSRLGMRPGADDYRRMLRSMMFQWRRGFGGAGLPFVIVQLPNYFSDDDDTWTILREVQRDVCRKTANTSLAVTIDVGDRDDGHPLNKKPVGERAAQQALVSVYGRRIVAGGPVPISARFGPGRAAVKFDGADGGLVLRPTGRPESGFTIAGRNRQFVPAEAVIHKGSVIVTSASVRHPVAVRYAWGNDPPVSLYNAEGFPASPFRTDRWPLEEPFEKLPAHAVVVPPQAVQTSSLPLVDLDGRSDLQVVVDRRAEQYLGHPTTVLLDDGRTILAVYPMGHGRGPIVMKRSPDGGRTWSPPLATPASWATSLEVPTIYPVTDRAGVKRLILFSGLYPIRMSVSEDEGVHWSELEPIGEFGGIVAMSDCIRLANGSYLATFHDDGRFLHGSGRVGKLFRLYACTSRDGGLTWSSPRRIFARRDVHLCEAGLVRRPDGRQLAMLMRENSRARNSMVSFSDDEGATWSPPRELPAALNGDRHQAVYAPDGRLVISFRRTAVGGRPAPQCEGDWMAWVGSYDDIAAGREGQYLIRLKDNLHHWDCAYPAMELLPDGTIVATTYGHWTQGQPPYILSVQFTLAITDSLVPKP